MPSHALVLRRSPTLQVVAAVVLLVVAAGLLFTGSEDSALPPRPAAAESAPEKIPAPNGDIDALDGTARRAAPNESSPVPSSAKEVTVALRPASAERFAAPDDDVSESFAFGPVVPVTDPRTGEEGELGAQLIFYESPEDDIPGEPLIVPIIRQICGLAAFMCHPVEEEAPDEENYVP